MARRPASPAEALKELRSFRGTLRVIETFCKEIAKVDIDSDKVAPLVQSMVQNRLTVPKAGLCRLFKSECLDLVRHNKFSAVALKLNVGEVRILWVLDCSP